MTAPQVETQTAGSGSGLGGAVELSVSGLSVYAHHGTLEEERTLGQQFSFDLDLLTDQCRACRTDELADAVDYGAVVAVVVEVATRFRFQLIEALAEAVCLELLEEFPITRVRVRVHKPAPAQPPPVAGVSVTLERTREDLEAVPAT